jgi:hypothetical protein
MLWVDKYRPKDLAVLDFHDSTTQLLDRLVKTINLGFEL